MTRILAALLAALALAGGLSACKSGTRFDLDDSVTVTKRAHAGSVDVLHLSSGKKVRVEAGAFPVCQRHRVYPICKTLKAGQ